MEFTYRHFGEKVPEIGDVFTEDGIRYKIVELRSVASNSTGWYASGLAKKNNNTTK